LVFVCVTGSAVAAVAGGGGAEGAFAAVAGLEGGDGGAVRGWWEEGGEAVLDELVGVLDGLRRVGRERVADGVGVGVPFKPGRDSGDQSVNVFLGEGEFG
jgi:hypothetical protein